MDKEILEITKKFHDTYEKLASEYTYETREDTKVFDINSNNGKLMYAVVNEIVSPILKENQELKIKINNKIDDYKRMKYNFDSKVDVLTEIDTQQKEFINYLEDEIKKDLDIGKLNLRLDDTKFTQYLICEIILQKYKEIIGVSDENRTTL